MEEKVNYMMVAEILEDTKNEHESIKEYGGDKFNALDIAMFNRFPDENEPDGLYEALNEILKIIKEW